MQQRTSIESFRLPSLDGWRAASIGLVLGAHSRRTVGFPSALNGACEWLFDGNLGVRVFFIISGFLITWLMICEFHEKGKVSLLHFYVRRALRILPVYCAFILVLMLLQRFTPYHQSAATWIGNITFTTNFVSEGNWASGHLWSLAVEEQFYLMWPSLFVMLSLARKFGRAILILLAAILLAPLSRVITNVVGGGSSLQMSVLASYFDFITNPQSPFAFLRVVFNPFSFFNYFDCLAWGAACAFLLARDREGLRTHLLGGRLHLTCGLGLVLIIGPYVLGHLHLVKWIIGPLGSSLQSCGFCLLLLQSVLCSDWGFYRVLNWRWIARIGVLSYSIYIWQQLFCADPALFAFGPVWWMSFPGWLIAVFAVASVSYYGFERPLLKLRTHFRDIK